MPGYDGTGPEGKGPMTGRGMGYCAMPLYTLEQEREFLNSLSRILKIELRKLESRIEEIENTESAVKV